LNFLADLGVNLSRIELKIFGGHRNYARWMIGGLIL